LRWGIDLARAARRAAGLDANSLGLGAYVNVAVHPDLDVARRLVAGGLSTLARFNVMHGRTAGPLGPDDRAVLTTLHERYDMNHHTQPGSAQADSLTPDFAGRHAVLGSPAHVLERFAALIELGIDRFVVMGAPRAPGLDDEGKYAQQAFVAEVLPTLVAA
jgi:5,10-methylenetetrahydromethanopterin reductase